MKIISKKTLSIASVVVLAIPFLANAAAGQTLKDVIMYTIMPYVNIAIYVLMGVAMVMFVFYVIKYFIKPSDGAERAEAGKYVMYSVIGFFVILSIWGLVSIVTHTFNLDSSPQNLADFQNIFPTQ